MDIFRFINSKDIKEYLKKINYQFNSLEAAWLVYQCRDATIAEKHSAWKAIMETMPDAKLQERRHYKPEGSLYDTVDRYMNLQDELISKMHESTPDTIYHVCECWNHTDWDTDSTDYYSSYSDCINDIKNRKDKELTGFRIEKFWVKGEGKVPGSIMLGLNSRLEEKTVYAFGNRFMSIKPLLYDFFMDMWFDFPTPFGKGDIVWDPLSKHGICSGPFVIEGVGPGEEIKKNCILYGDNTDMFTSGYFVNEDGTIHHDCMDNYMDLEYYDKELSGSEMLLKMISALMNGKTKKDLLEFSCEMFATGRVKESLHTAGLSPEPEHVKIWLDDIREADGYWKGRYGKLDKNELIELNSWDDSFARVILDDYDWMHYTIEFTFRTEKYGKMNTKFEFTGLQESTMTITNGETVTVYKYDSKLFEKWIVPYLSRHNEQWKPPKAFRGEDLILNFYNDVIENGTIANED